MKRAVLILLFLTGICYARFDSNLVAWWQLNDDLATTAVVDSIGSNTGTASANTEDMTTPGKVNGALIFDGTDDVVNCGNDSSIDDIFMGGGTVSIWLFISGRGENTAGHAIFKGSWWIYSEAFISTLLFGQLFDSAELSMWTFPATPGIWQHVVVVYDSSLGANDPTIYVSGVEVLATQHSGPAANDTEVSDAASSLLLGDHSASTRGWDGKIDNVMLFTKELTAKEVKYLYNGGRGLEVLGQRILRGRYSGNRRIRQNIH